MPLVFGLELHDLRSAVSSDGSPAPTTAPTRLAAAPQEERADGDEDGATERERGARRCTTATGNDPAGTIDAVLIDPNTEIVGKRDRPP